jgi:DNA-binding NarL/FixJ family response regulator
MKDFLGLFKNRISDSPANTPEQAAGASTGKNGLSPEFIERYGLSSRQADVTQALLLGKPDKDIAALLKIELNTVKTHLKKIYRKTGVRGRYALMVLVGNDFYIPPVKAEESQYKE